MQGASEEQTGSYLVKDKEKDGVGCQSHECWCPAFEKEANAFLSQRLGDNTKRCGVCFRLRSISKGISMS